MLRKTLSYFVRYPQRRVSLCTRVHVCSCWLLSLVVGCLTISRLKDLFLLVVVPTEARPSHSFTHHSHISLSVSPHGTLSLYHSLTLLVHLSPPYHLASGNLVHCYKERWLLAN